MSIDKKVVVSLVQPSGDLTIGNYLGAIKNYKKFQDEYETYFAVADMHSITVPQVPSELRKRTLDVLAYFIACGLDENKNTLFIQSHVEEHIKLFWVLSSISYMGQLSRMTQYKQKSQKSEENLNASLFTYPILMASDILLYQADYVPVGKDQMQHLELARDLAIRFNQKYSHTFKVPEGYINTELGKINSLKDPTKKMSKSDDDVNSYILLKDDEVTIKRKIRRAVTDSYKHFNYSQEQKGLMNLINIYHAFTNISISDIVDKYKDLDYSVFKDDLAIEICKEIIPIQNKYNELINNKDYLEEIYNEGMKKASYVAKKTLNKVYRKVGFLLK